MTNSITITAAETNRRKALLEAKLNELLGSDDRTDLQIEYMADPLDQVRSSTDREMAIRRVDQHARTIREIRNALERIESGSYGFCEHCEELIPRKRLDIVPWAAMCVPCQAGTEAVEYDGEPEFEHAA